MKGSKYHSTNRIFSHLNQVVEMELNFWGERKTVHTKRHDLSLKLFTKHAYSCYCNINSHKFIVI